MYWVIYKEMSCFENAKGSLSLKKKHNLKRELKKNLRFPILSSASMLGLFAIAAIKNCVAMTFILSRNFFLLQVENCVLLSNCVDNTVLFDCFCWKTLSLFFSVCWETSVTALSVIKVSMNNTTLIFSSQKKPNQLVQMLAIGCKTESKNA